MTTKYDKIISVRKVKKALGIKWWHGEEKQVIQLGLVLIYIGLFLTIFDRVMGLFIK